MSENATQTLTSTQAYIETISKALRTGDYKSRHSVRVHSVKDLATNRREEIVKMLSIKVILVLSLALTVTSEQVCEDDVSYNFIL